MRVAKIGFVLTAVVVYAVVAYVLIVNSGLVDMSQTPDWLTP